MAAYDIKLDEKYRPRTTADLVGNQGVIQSLNEMLKNKNIPHLLFSGPQGTGKTSASGVIIRALYNGNSKRKFLEINASEKNGVDVMRTDVKNFAMNSGSQNKVPFRIIILDEADNMTPAAQAALRRTMEKYHKHCRFIIICNYPWKIIDPIKSRCTMLEFERIKKTEMIPRLQLICDLEKIDIDKEALKLIAERCNGDMRAALNSYLERVRHINNGKITIENIKGIVLDSGSVVKILKNSLNGRFVNGRQAFYSSIKKGINIRTVLKQISNSVVSHKKYPNEMKGDISLSILQTEQAILQGCSDEIVIAGLIGSLMKIGVKYKPK